MYEERVLSSTTTVASEASAESQGISERDEVKRKIRDSILAASKMPSDNQNPAGTSTEDADDSKFGPSQKKGNADQQRCFKAGRFDLTYAHRSELRSIFDPYVEKNMVQLNLETFRQNRDDFLKTQGSNDGTNRIYRLMWDPLPWPHELQDLADEAKRHIQDNSTLLGQLSEDQATMFLDTSPLDLWRAQTAIMSRMLDGKLSVHGGIFETMRTEPLSIPDLGPFRSPDQIYHSLPWREIEVDHAISCRICFEQLKPGAGNRYLHNDPNHVFCNPCIRQSLEHKFECPICRKLIQV